MAPVRKQVDWRKMHAMKKKRKHTEIEKYLLDNQKLQEEVDKETFNEEVVSDTVKSNIKTISLALPGSILDTVDSPVLRTYLIGQIARVACIYKIDEVVIFDDTCSTSNSHNAEESLTWQNCIFFCKILQYLECPQYLRKLIFPMNHYLNCVGVLNPLEAPHHFRAHQQSIYREGIVTDQKNGNGTKSFAEVGLTTTVKLDRLMDPGTRITVKLPPKCQGTHKLNGVPVSSWEPKVKLGLYWGYEVRLAASIAEVFGQCPHKKGYNLCIGTSDKGEPLNNVTLKIKKKSHVLVVFGGLKGLEFALESDKSLDVDDVSLLFDHYVNTCPNQGTRTIRTEEAIPISLAHITNKLFSEPVES